MVFRLSYGFEGKLVFGEIQSHFSVIALFFFLLNPPPLEPRASSAAFRPATVVADRSYPRISVSCFSPRAIRLYRATLPERTNEATLAYGTYSAEVSISVGGSANELDA